MPRYPESIESAIRLYVRDMEERGGYSPRTLRGVVFSCSAAWSIVVKFQEEAIPRNVTVETLRQTLDWLRANYSVATQKNYFFYIRELMKKSDNHAYDRIRAVYPADLRPNVDWLTLDEAMTLIRTEFPPMERIIVVLGLCQGLRRIEMTNLRVTDIHVEGQYITVLGKGTGGGKFRSVHFHPIFHTVFLRWMETRTNLAHQCRDDRSDNALLVYIKKGELRAYATHTLSDIIKKMSDHVGIEFSAHTLRRTFGREMYHSGVRIETIARILGHSSTEMTLRYIGVNLDDQAQAMNQFILR